MQIQEASKGVANGIKGVTRKSFRMHRLVPLRESIASSGPSDWVTKRIHFAGCFICSNIFL